MEFKIGMILDGEITGVQQYGAFVSLENDVQGLIHISEVRHGFIKNISEVLQTGKKVTVKIIDIDEYSGKISLSMRALEEQIHIPSYRRKKYFTNRRKKIGFETLKDRMPEWISESMHELTGK